MIRFFSVIRKKLLDDNRLRKYLVYAVGEIFLVVIGIIIALQVNSWNDQRKKQEELNVLFKDTELFLGAVSPWARDFSARYAQIDSVLDLLQSPERATFYTQQPEYTQFLFADSLSITQPSYYWVSPGMTELIGRQPDFKEAQKSLFVDLSTYQTFSMEVQQVTFEFDEYLDGLRLRLIDSAPFLVENDPASVEQAITFVSQGGWYAYELKKVQGYIKDLIKVMDLQWGAYTNLYGQLLLDQYEASPEDLNALFKELGRTPMVNSAMAVPEKLKTIPGYKANRGQFLPKKAQGLPTSWVVIYNPKDEPFDIEVIHEDHLIAEWKVSKGAIIRRRVIEGAKLRVHSNEEISAVYTADKGQYLILN